MQWLFFFSLVLSCSILASQAALVSVLTHGNTNGVDLVFSDPVPSSAALARDNYTIHNGTAPVPIESVELLGETSVRLKAPLPPGFAYDLQISNVEPAVSNTTFVQSHGIITRRIYLGAADRNGLIPSEPITETVPPPFDFEFVIGFDFASGFPTSEDYVLELEHPNGTGEDHYGMMIEGILTAPMDGEYLFFLASDDNGEFWLSTDESPENKQRIAVEPFAGSFRAYVIPVGFGTPATRMIPTYTGMVPCNISKPITLRRGKRYYIQALMTEHEGDDFLSVAWRKPNDLMVLNGDPPIPGAYLSPYGAPFGPVLITRHPARASASSGNIASFNVEVTGAPPYTFQWFADGVPIPGATNGTFQYGPITPEDHLKKIQVEARNKFSSMLSDEAILRVKEAGAGTAISIQKQGEDFLLSWPEEAVGMTLEYTELLEGPLTFWRTLHETSLTNAWLFSHDPKLHFFRLVEY